MPGLCIHTVGERWRRYQIGQGVAIRWASFYRSFKFWQVFLHNIRERGRINQRLLGTCHKVETKGPSTRVEASSSCNHFSPFFVALCFYHLDVSFVSYWFGMWTRTHNLFLVWMFFHWVLLTLSFPFFFDISVLLSNVYHFDLLSLAAL